MKFIYRIARMLILICCVYAVVRICVCDRFIVRGESMNPTFRDGEAVYVNKLIFGGRIYKDLDFTKSKLNSFRLPGLRDIRVGDVLMLNYPYARSKDTINFKINHVYLKRCLGRPGDTVRIVDGFYINPETGKRMLCNEFSNLLNETTDSILVKQGVVVNAFQINKSLEWTIRNFGPFYIPAKGSKVCLTPSNYKNYKKQIRYETGYNLELEGGSLKLGNCTIESYTFKTNWYFMGGDNVLNSKDSRYFGLVPEEYIIGVVKNGVKRFND